MYRKYEMEFQANIETYNICNFEFSSVSIIHLECFHYKCLDKLFNDKQQV